MKREETIDYHIRSAWHAISRMYNQRAQKYNATMSMGFALLVIDAEEGTPATKIGPMMGLEPRSLTRLLKSLEEKKLIARASDKQDKRSVRICLTKEGKKQRDNAREAVVRFNEVVQSEVGAQKLAVCLEVLEKVNQVVERGNIYEEVGSRQIDK
jgi:MarR family transcriptional regulator, organic hydroperoxide resistance regulator